MLHMPFRKSITLALLLLGSFQAVAKDVYFRDLFGTNYLPPGKETAKDLGIGWVREDFSWAQVEKIKGTYNWAQLDKKVKSAHAQGVEVLPLLAYTPAWNRVTPKTTGSEPKDYQAWVSFVQAAVDRYSKAPFNLKYFQIWNEPTRKASYWLGSNQDFIDKIYLPAAKIIKNHHGKVVFGGWPASNGLKEFADTIEYHDAIKYTDVIDFHYGNLRPYQWLYDRYVATGKVEGIWQTELGYTAKPESVALVYSYILDFATTHKWDDPMKYKAFWFPAWQGNKKPLRSMTVTASDRSVAYTDNGKQLLLLNSFFSGGPLVRESLIKQPATNNDSWTKYFAINVGEQRQVITSTYKPANKQQSYQYQLKSLKQNPEATLYFADGSKQKVPVKTANGVSTINVAGDLLDKGCQSCERSVFYIVLS
ncbi:hypothetical protein N5923_15140 [Erwiniaceae bacterium BAC15a-03b]|uniref:Glycosyl hydrolase family 39 n=1 Tax=Winslowiella arboricola TaxID=2978220 RepID=A0A9J6PN53_9GAMM|nr:hypothetical protein [Winslowiella arboricola]MCU5774279.1 hypothetical protein [Winslowiella arboricola]MCU5778826.1 hypothetical protein [Winslowiella arboricola]